MRTTDTSTVSRLEGLTLGEPLGQGGMSRVREATTAEGCRVAIKFSRLHGASHAAARALVHREFGFLDGISHPNVVSVFGLARVPDCPGAPAAQPGMVMEYLEGGDLVPLAGAPPRCWAPVAAQIARAVEHLHRSGIVHRDLKPRNILLRSDDAPCLIDFALAARVGAPTLAGGGTAAYRRRAATDEADATHQACVADDVYALAVVVYELWTGALPYGRRPARSNGARRREFPELRSVPGVYGLKRLADVLSGILSLRNSALDSGIRPLRHALESVGSDRTTRNRTIGGD